MGAKGHHVRGGTNLTERTVAIRESQGAPGRYVDILREMIADGASVHNHFGNSVAETNSRRDKAKDQIHKLHV